MTLLAPSNDAFGALPPDTLTRLGDPMQRGALDAMLRRHLYAGRHGTSELLDGGSPEAPPLARAIVPDLAARNGLIHVIDRVLPD